MLVWKPEMSVGNDILDEDHKSFFSLVSLLQDALAHGGEEMVVESAINLLKDYVNGHFIREEMAMLAAKYPDVEAHIKEHVRFTEGMEKAIQAYRQNPEGAVESLAKMTGKWWADHILTVDSKYKGYIKDEHVDTRPLGFLAGSFDPEDDNDIFGN